MAAPDPRMIDRCVCPAHGREMRMFGLVALCWPSEPAKERVTTADGRRVTIEVWRRSTGPYDQPYLSFPQLRTTDETANLADGTEVPVVDVRSEGSIDGGIHPAQARALIADLQRALAFIEAEEAHP